MLVAARDFCRDAPFCFTSTNKVYGDRPNALPLLELATRYDYADGLDGISETGMVTISEVLSLDFTNLRRLLINNEGFL
jgi:CDP-paratose 2-epimerase